MSEKFDKALSKSHSSMAGVGILEKVRENLAFFRMRVRGSLRGSSPAQFDRLFQEVAEYDRELQAHCNLSLANARVLEVGYGARPNRLLALASMGIDVKGIYLDRPMLEFDFATIAEIYKRNGFERALKSAVRSLIFDAGERRSLKTALAQKGHSLRLEKERFLVGNASTIDLPAASLDLVYSEDVFEHIQIDEVKALLKKMRVWLKRGGIALIRPCIFTGITGGHLTEWYPHTLNMPMERRTEPWEHLRKQRIQANCFLNKLRPIDYRSIFSKDFEICEERVESPNQGRNFLTPEVRRELEEYDETELLSNRVLFVLRPRETAAVAAHS